MKKGVGGVNWQKAGLILRVTRNDDGTYAWESRYFGKHVANGSAKTEDAAEKQMKEMTWPLLRETVKKTGDRQKLLMKLRYYVERRSMLALWVAIQRQMNMPREMTVEHAAEEEVALAEKWGHTLSTHPLVKPAGELAGTIWDTLDGLGWSTARFNRWGWDTFGVAFDNRKSNLILPADGPQSYGEDIAES